MKIGFSGEKVPVGWNDHYKASALQIGLIIKSRDGYGNRFKNCMVFSLENAQGQPVSIYGRNIIDDGPGRHYYLPGGHQGLYPSYPKLDTKKLILTEAIIDTATLHQHTAIVDEYTVLACYGTNGFTTEHEQSIKELKQT